ncbi:hypothetical protein SSBR45G_40980 [Bradyrhizobium sp. SSBR45G]|uniref:hypothetical protein n=1 Tax=unclassified Bradyrhizobium TaxID=2631580 RepID=UPI002342A06F|nr:MULTISPECIES: hypothetical protein [unclassified Bradyrhizobium]GLH79189.1 hypothetical protein SSBR45G_40980 [Bradyrhizobium sp. SSBR45G]GLH84624.1 hypothetical protein SSBR45R_20840 [Bradyrhizobium sp. SSBR45R]
MQGDQPISWLMFFTLAAAIVIASGAFLAFLRSRHNREIAAVALQGDGRGRGMAPSGALPELGGLVVLGLIVGGLLVAGYQSGGATRFAGGSKPTPATTAPSNTDRGTTVGAGAAITPPEAPTMTQPARPGPDLRTAPASSPAGAGPESGGHPEANPPAR